MFRMGGGNRLLKMLSFTNTTRFLNKIKYSDHLREDTVKYRERLIDDTLNLKFEIIVPFN